MKVRVFYNPETGGGAGGGAGGAATGAEGGATGAGGGTSDQTFTKADVERMIAAEKAKLSQTTGQTAKELATLRQLKSQMEGFLQGGEASSLEEFRAKFDNTAAELMTEKDKADRLTKDYETEKSARAAIEQKYKTKTITGTIATAINGKMVNSGAAELLVDSLSRFAELNKEDEVVFKIPVDVEGKTVHKSMKVADAVKWAETQVERYGALFKSTASQGAGGQPNNVNQFKNDKGVLSPEAIAQLTMPQFEKLYKENPAALGLA